MPAMPRVRSRILLAALSLSAALAPAALPAQAGAPPLAVDARNAPPPRVVLLTMGPGSAVWERFGHNAIWVQDPATGIDHAFNYGMFDFAQENFLANFIRGRMEYWMEPFDARRMMGFYQQQNRTIWAQELNLTPRQAVALRDFLLWNARPENRLYRYDYYRDNCSTRVRDALDRVLGGVLQAASDSAPAGTTYRWHTARLTGVGAGDVPIYTALMGGLGPAADRPISKWEEMFLPEKLRDGVRAARVRDASGRLVPLMRSERVIYEATRPAERAAPPRWTLGYLLAGVALAAVLALLAVRARRSGAARFGFSAVAALWLLFAGTGGVVLAGLWAFTDHAIAYGNENLLQLSPLALPLVLLLPCLAYGARWAARWAVWLSLAVAALSLLGLALQAIPGLDQVNGPIVALALPANLSLAWCARRLAGWAHGRAAPAPGTPVVETKRARATA